MDKFLQKKLVLSSRLQLFAQQANCVAILTDYGHFSAEDSYQLMEILWDMVEYSVGEENNINSASN